MRFQPDVVEIDEEIFETENDEKRWLKTPSASSRSNICVGFRQKSM